MSLRNKALAGLMLSTVMVSVSAPSIKGYADSTEQKIAQKDATIKSAQSGAAEAKAKADAMQSKVDAANNQLSSLMKEQKATSSKITTLISNIKERENDLQAQARSAQTEGGMSSYVETILNAKSLPEMIQNVSGMTQIVSANKQMLTQQEQDKKELQTKLQSNMKAYNEATKIQQNLTVQKAQLKAAQLNYEATITTASGEKAKLVAEQKAAEEAAAKAAAEQAAQQKAAAEQAAKVAAAQQAQEAKAQAVQVSTSTPAATPTEDTSNTTSDSTSNSNSNSGSSSNSNSGSGSSSNTNNGGGSTSTPGTSSSNPYPWGQCTWGVWEILGGNMPTYAGNAGDWAAYANASGPAAGEIAVFAPGAYGAGGVGHVAVVTSVSGKGFTVSETNYGATDGIIKSRFIPGTAGVSFIRP